MFEAKPILKMDKHGHPLLWTTLSLYNMLPQNFGSISQVVPLYHLPKVLLSNMATHTHLFGITGKSTA